MKSDFIRKMVFPVMVKRWHPYAKRYLAEAKTHEFAPTEVVQTLQWARLKAIVRHATQHAPYCRSPFCEQRIKQDDIRSPRDFARLPVLTKATLQQKSGELVAENRERSDGQPNANGGSTGKPLQFFQGAEFCNRAYANQWFIKSLWGIRPGDRTASLWGADRDIPGQRWRERVQSEIAQVRVCNAFALKHSQMEEFQSEGQRP